MRSKAECREYYLTHQEEIKTRSREYGRAHKEERKLYDKEYRWKHPEVKAANSKKYRQRHPERCKIRQKEYCLAHREEIAARSKEYRRTHQKERRSYDKKRQRKRNLFSKYGITIEMYDQMSVAQEGKCAICGRHQSEFANPFAVDHSHKTDKVRALLCIRCNTGLGSLGDTSEGLRKAINYLEFWEKEGL